MGHPEHDCSGSNSGSSGDEGDDTTSAGTSDAGSSADSGNGLMVGGTVVGVALVAGLSVGCSCGEADVHSGRPGVTDPQPGQAGMTAVAEPPATR
jgi:hypothetical protein